MKRCLLLLLGEMRLPVLLMHRSLWELRWHEGHRSFWLHRWHALGCCEDELPMERWPCRVLRDSCGTKLMFRTDVWVVEQTKGRDQRYKSIRVLGNGAESGQIRKYVVVYDFED